MSLAGQQHIVEVIQDGGLFPGWYTQHDLFQDDGVSFSDLRVPVTNSRPGVLEPFASALSVALKPALDLELDIAASSGIPLDTLDIQSQWGVSAQAVRDGLTARKLPGGRTPSTGFLSELAITPIDTKTARPGIRDLAALNSGNNPINASLEAPYGYPYTRIAFEVAAKMTGAAAIRRCGIAMELRRNTGETAEAGSRYLLLGKVVRYTR